MVNDFNADLFGQTALVTGSSRGIGKAIATDLSRCGAQVVINHPCNPDEAKSAAKEVRKVSPLDEENVMIAQADVSKETDVKTMFEDIKERFGPIDILVNNAGVKSRVSIFDLTADEWNRILSVNLTGTFLCCREAAIQMIESGGGNIVNISSELGYLGSPDLAHYCASKGGVITLTRSMARELAPEIRVNSVAPGPVGTNFLYKDLESAEENEMNETPMGRVGIPEEVSPAVVFLVSDAASFFTGQILNPNGGAAMY